jgi:hypothetical protein
MMQYDLSTLPTSEVSTEVKGLNLSIIKYRKPLLTEDNVKTLGLFRSVIIERTDDGLQHRVVAFSPPKSISSEAFTAEHPLSECVIEEFIDGTMINVFWSEVANEWVVSTKSNIGANSHFFVFPMSTAAKSEHTKTFYDMFTEALCGFDLNVLDKSLSYSFVLQHPMNRIVSPVTRPTLYIVGIYRLNGDQVIPVDVQSYPGFQYGSPIRKPQRYEASSYEELEQRFAGKNPQAPTPYNVMGIVIKHQASGQRTKFRNPAYEYVKALRGNNPRLDYRYLELRQSNRVKEFLLYYPECAPSFSEYRNKIHTFTNHLYKNYVDCYILKKNKLSYFSTQYKTNMYNLHQLYFNTYKPNNQYITHSAVVKFVNSLSITLLLHLMNYEIVQSQKPLADKLSALA